MTTETLLIFIAISAGLILIPGPNVLMIVSNSIQHGTRAGLITVAGTSAAMALQLAIVILGISSLLLLVAEWFHWLRWLGAAYLIYLGVKALFKTSILTRTPVMTKERHLFAQGFLVSILNPKTLLFFSAFLPQFVSTASPALPQLLLLSSLFLGLAILFDSGYVLLSSKIMARLSHSTQRLSRRIGGVMLIGAGALVGSGQTNKTP